MQATLSVLAVACRLKTSFGQLRGRFAGVATGLPGTLQSSGQAQVQRVASCQRLKKNVSIWRLISVIKVLFFGLLRDIVGMPEETCELPPSGTLGGVFEAYGNRFPRLRELRRSIVLARNHEFCDPAVSVGDGDEIAFLPPVSGG